MRVNVLDRIVVEHVADKLFAIERCRSIATDLINRSGLLRRKTDDRRGQVRAQIEQIERTLARWETIRDIFISADTAMTKNSLRLLVERIVVGDGRGRLGKPR